MHRYRIIDPETGRFTNNGYTRIRMVRHIARKRYPNQSVRVLWNRADGSHKWLYVGGNA